MNVVQIFGMLTNCLYSSDFRVCFQYIFSKSVLFSLYHFFVRPVFFVVIEYMHRVYALDV